MARNGYDFYLDKCLLPVTPSKLQIKINNANKTLTLIDDGQINILKKAGLTDIEFDCMIPQVKYPFATYKSGFKGAGYFLDYFEELKTSGKPFQFIVSRALPFGKALFNTNIKVSMEKYDIIEDAKNGFDLEVKVKLKQWRDHGTKTVNVTLESSKPVATVQQPRAAENSPAPVTTKTHQVVSGDTLWGLAKKYYGNGSQYTKIYEANRDKVKNANVIYIGQVLTIPAV